MPRKPGQKLIENPKHVSIMFHVGSVVRNRIEDKSFSEGLSYTDYMVKLIRKLLNVIKAHEKVLDTEYVNNKDYVAIGSNALYESEHEYIYRLVAEYRLFFSRSEFLRFCVLFDMLTNVNNTDLDPELPKFKPRMKIEKLTKNKNKQLTKLQEEKILFPTRPEYKAMNEE